MLRVLDDPLSRAIFALVHVILGGIRHICEATPWDSGKILFEVPCRLIEAVTSDRSPATISGSQRSRLKQGGDATWLLSSCLWLSGFDPFIPVDDLNLDVVVDILVRLKSFMIVERRVSKRFTDGLIVRGCEI